MTTRVIATIVVHALGSMVSHLITNGKVWLVERVLKGYSIAWASLMLT